MCYAAGLLTHVKPYLAKLIHTNTDHPNWTAINDGQSDLFLRNRHLKKIEKFTKTKDPKKLTSN